MSQDRLSEFQRLLASGLPLAEIALRLGVHLRTIWKLKKRLASVEPPPSSQAETSAVAPVHQADIAESLRRSLGREAAAIAAAPSGQQSGNLLKAARGLKLLPPAEPDKHQPAIDAADLRAKIALMLTNADEASRQHYALMSEAELEIGLAAHAAERRAFWRECQGTAPEIELPASGAAAANSAPPVKPLPGDFLQKS